MQRHPSVQEKLELAYDLVSEILGEAPQLYELHLEQALLVLVPALRRARRSPKLRTRPPRPQYQDQELQFYPPAAKGRRGAPHQAAAPAHGTAGHTPRKNPPPHPPLPPSNLPPTPRQGSLRHTR